MFSNFSSRLDEFFITWTSIRLKLHSKPLFSSKKMIFAFLNPNILKWKKNYFKAQRSFTEKWQVSILALSINYWHHILKLYLLLIYKFSCYSNRSNLSMLYILKSSISMIILFQEAFRGQSQHSMFKMHIAILEMMCINSLLPWSYLILTQYVGFFSLSLSLSLSLSVCLSHTHALVHTHSWYHTHEAQQTHTFDLVAGRHW